MTLQQDLRDYVEQAASPITLEEVAERVSPLPDPFEPVDSSPTRGVRGRLVVAGVVALVLVAAGLMAVTSDPEPGLAVSASGSDQPFRGEWTEIGQLDPLALPLGRLEIHELVVVGDRVFAVGAEVEGAGAVTALWRSRGGGAWERVVADVSSAGESGIEPRFVPAGLRLDSLVEHDGALVLLGSEIGAGIVPVVLYSDNGQDWSRATMDIDSDAVITGGSVVSTSGGIVLVGIDNRDVTTGEGNAIVAFRSDTGRSWDQITPSGIELGSTVSDLIVIEDRILAIGSVGGFAGEAAAWTSDDFGHTWARSGVEAISSELPISSMSYVAGEPGQLLALGHRQSERDIGTSQGDNESQIEINGLGDLALWRSDDNGLSWVELQVPSLPNSLELESSLSSGPAGFLISAAAVPGSEPLLWTTSDGTSLAPLAIPPESGDIAAVAIVDNRYIIATTDQSRGVELSSPGSPIPVKVWYLD